MTAVTTWADFAAAEPNLADRTRARFEAHGLALLATLRADGAPRISGIEPLIGLGELWLAMMPDGRKSADLRRDPRLTLHNATTDKAVTDGDVKVSGRAVADSDPDSDPDPTSEVGSGTGTGTGEIARFRDEFERQTGQAPPPGDFDLWRVDLTEVSMITPAGDHLVIETWHPGHPVRRVKRY